MAITNGYTTLNEINAEMDFTTGADADRDAYIEKIIEAASRWIDNWTGRRFFASTETRYYSPEFWDEIDVDDLLSVTTLKTDPNLDRTFSDLWETTDFDLMPLNATSDNIPFYKIEVAPGGTYSFIRGNKTVQIIGSFGYSTTTPKEIERACFLLTLRLYKRDDTPLGVSAAGGVGTQSVVIPAIVNDPDIVGLLAGFRKLI